MRKIIERFRRSKRGATAIEYGLLAVLISVAIVTGSNGIDDGLKAGFNDVVDAFPD